MDTIKIADLDRVINHMLQIAGLDIDVSSGTTESFKLDLITKSLSDFKNCGYSTKNFWDK